MIQGKIAVIGTGNMGGAMLKGIVKSGICPKENIYIYDAYAPLKEKLAGELGVNACKCEACAAKAADYIIVAVKPDVVASVAETVSSAAAGKTVITIAAGRKISVYDDIFTKNGVKDVKIVRAIPNLPAMVGEGMSGIFFNNVTDEKEKSDIREIFAAFGKSVEVKKETDIDKMISVTSSSPAYVCMIVEAIADGAVRAGFKREDAYVMAEQTLLGTCRYLLEEKVAPAVLKDRICSPGGTTIEAVAALEKNGLRNAILEAMEACEKKALNM